MLSAARLTAFLATAHPALAREFYERTLGLRVLSEDDFALAFDANGVELRIQKVDVLQPQSHTALGWNVPDIRSTVIALGGRGVTFERYPFLSQDPDGVWTAPSGAMVAWFKDPDGNLLSVAQHTSS